MTGFGSPCGACKFLRRKCVRGCVFAPYFCHEQGPEHFAAIHKVFGASNVSKLLLHLPVEDRLEAAVTLSYEAQARLQDPIYGCVSHIFALQQQVVSLQAQLVSLKTQAAAQALLHDSPASSPQEEKPYERLHSYHQISGSGLIHVDNPRTMQHLAGGPSVNIESMLRYDNAFFDPNSAGSYHQYPAMAGEQICFTNEDDSCHSMATFEMERDSRKLTFQEMEDLQSVAFGYAHHT